MHFEIGILGEPFALAAFPQPLDELDDTDLVAIAQRAGDGAPGGGRLALAIAGEHQQLAALLSGLRHLVIDMRLEFFHRGLVAGIAIRHAYAP